MSHAISRRTRTTSAVLRRSRRNGSLPSVRRRPIAWIVSAGIGVALTSGSCTRHREIVIPSGYVYHPTDWAVAWSSPIGPIVVIHDSRWVRGMPPEGSARGPACTLPPRIPCRRYGPAGLRMFVCLTSIGGRYKASLMVLRPFSARRGDCSGGSSAAVWFSRCRCLLTFPADFPRGIKRAYELSLSAWIVARVARTKRGCTLPSRTGVTSLASWISTTCTSCRRLRGHRTENRSFSLLAAIPVHRLHQSRRT